MTNPILALSAYAEHERALGHLGAPGFRPVEFHICIDLDFQGVCQQVRGLSQPSETRKNMVQGVVLWVPMIDRSSDKTPRILGDDERYIVSDTTCRNLFVQRLDEIAAVLEEAGVKHDKFEAVRRFYEHHLGTLDLDDLEIEIRAARVGRAAGFRPNITFSVSEEGLGGEPILTDQELVTHLRPSLYRGEELIATCCLTGLEVPVARLHGQVRGSALSKAGAQDTGARLISFNNENAQSYGTTTKTGYLNGPMDARIVESYTDGFFLLNQFENRRAVIGSERRVVYNFMARDGGAAIIERERAAIIGDTSGEESEKARQELAVINALSHHPHAASGPLAISLDDPINTLVIAPQGGRLAIVDFAEMPVAERYAQVERWAEDMRLEHGPQVRQPFVNIKQFLAALQGFVPEARSVNEWPDGDREVFTQDLYLAATMGRTLGPDILIAAIHAWRSTVQGVRGVLAKKGAQPPEIERYVMRTQHRLAALAKLCLTRGPESQRCPLPAELDRECDLLPYLYGRMFACMVFAQERAQPSINSGFTSMMGAAMRSPGAVLTRLQAKSSSHVERMRKMAERLDQSGGNEKERAIAWASFRKVSADMAEACGLVGGRPWKMALTPQEQGTFMVGYYLQRTAFFRRSETAGSDEPEIPEVPPSPVQEAA